MGKNLKLLAILLASLFLATPVYALTKVPFSLSTVTDIVGDKDGFGLGIEEGGTIKYDLHYGLAGGEVTDGWTNRGVLPLSWEHEFDLEGFSSISKISLELFTGGQGAYGESQVFLNDDIFIGVLQDGQSADNYARLDVFDLTQFQNLFWDGLVSITVKTQYSDGTYAESYAPTQFADLWILDYSQVTIYGYTNTAPTAVPEPETILLIIASLFVLGVFGLRNTKARA